MNNYLRAWGLLTIGLVCFALAVLLLPAHHDHTKLRIDVERSTLAECDQWGGSWVSTNADRTLGTCANVDH